MTNTPQIRFAIESDLPQLIKLCEHHASFEESQYQSFGKEKSLINHLFIENPALYCVVVELNNQLLGYATYMRQFSTWDACFYLYMDCLFLLESSRGLGIGKEIMKHITKQAILLNCTQIQWQTPKFNQHAIKFYEQIGAASKTKERFFLQILN